MRDPGRDGAIGTWIFDDLLPQSEAVRHKPIQLKILDEASSPGTVRILRWLAPGPLARIIHQAKLLKAPLPANLCVGLQERASLRYGAKGGSNDSGARTTLEQYRRELPELQNVEALRGSARVVVTQRLARSCASRQD